ncbi:MAG: M20/M25/M40 family metallo-hydrolase [Eubacteriales bacterium]|nr:M20/M25/M40 family metallo-hydrolase [Eubacteriales bacterium]MDD3880878.1 M20/M25/M40 family metallo-hydrolase [Eubacteriales bacterium]MDD4511755.1 M20/M25/M40 family metallo-hydrolase [Eubacteriales bacterium]
MDIEKFLREITAISGLSGREKLVAEYARESFLPYTDEAEIDDMYNMVVVHRGAEGGARIMICAHMDEIGMVVSKIEDDGSLRIWKSGGVDPRVLPASRVIVKGENGSLLGVVGAKAPHLLTPDEQKRNYSLDELYVDVGLDKESAEKQIRIGAEVTFEPILTKLGNGCLASKTMDDRACVGMMLECAEILSKRKTWANVYFTASSQEEVGSKGAETAAFRLNPDLAIAIDVTHGPVNGAPPDSTYPLNKLCLTKAPLIQKKLYERIIETADKLHIGVSRGVSGGDTYTDSDNIQFARDGIPTALIELPLKYMHTSVETLSLSTLHDGARLLAEFCSAIEAGWEEELWS